MAQLDLDESGNESLSTLVAKISTMFAELYSTVSGALSATSLTLSGALAAATGTFTGLMTAGSAKLDTGTKTATATAGAATLAKMSGIITSEALTTAAGALYTLTITNTTVAAADIAFASLQNGTNSAGTPHIVSVTPGSNSLVIVVRNDHATDALNGTLKIAFAVLKA